MPFYVREVVGTPGNIVLTLMTNRSRAGSSRNYEPHWPALTLSYEAEARANENEYY